MLGEMESIWDAMKDTHYNRTIEQLADSLQDTQNLEEALTASLDMVVRAIHAEAGTFWFYHRFSDGRIRAGAVYGGGNLDDVSLLPGEGIAGEVIETGESLIIPDCQADPRWAGKVDNKTGFTTRTMICVPLAVDGLVFGSIQIINKVDGLAFDEKDLEFAERLAEEISQLLKNRRLLEEFVRYTEESNNREASASFQEMVMTLDEREMVYRLRGMSEFAGLTIREQEKVIRLLRDLRKCFKKSFR